MLAVCDSSPQTGSSDMEAGIIVAPLGSACRVTSSRPDKCNVLQVSRTDINKVLRLPREAAL